MSELFEKSMETLELPRVLELLAAQAVTQEGKERARALRPETDPEEVRRRLQETTAAVDMMVKKGSPGFSGVKPVAGNLQRADMGGSLNTRELLDIAGVLAAARSAKDYGESDSEKKTVIDQFLKTGIVVYRSLGDSVLQYADQTIAELNGKTVIMISHRLANVVTADRIWVMEDGAVIESGTHEELLAIYGYYKKLNDMQSL